MTDTVAVVDKDIVEKYIDIQKEASVLLNKAQSLKLYPQHLFYRKPLRELNADVRICWEKIASLDEAFFGIQKLPVNMTDGDFVNMQITIVSAVRSTAVHTISEVRNSVNGHENLLNFAAPIFLTLATLFAIT